MGNIALSVVKEVPTSADDDQVLLYVLQPDGTFHTSSITIRNLRGSVMPIGSITTFAGVIAQVPQGWFLCDGSNETPNLSDRFVINPDGKRFDLAYIMRLS